MAPAWSYPYLGLSGVLLATMAVGMALLPAHRRVTLASAALSAPFSLYEVVFIPDYWAPAMIARHYVGIEDVVFSFASGGVAWVIPAAVLRRSVVVRWHLVTFLRRFVGGAGLGVLASLVFWTLGLPIMRSVLLCIVIGAAVLAWRYPHLHGLGFVGAVGFGLFYTMVLLGLFKLLPDFPSQWTSAGPRSTLLAGLPLEEVLWACGFGGIWPRFVAYVFDAREPTGPIGRGEAAVSVGGHRRP